MNTRIIALVAVWLVLAIGLVTVFVGILNYDTGSVIAGCTLVVVGGLGVGTLVTHRD